MILQDDYHNPFKHIPDGVPKEPKVYIGVIGTSSPATDMLIANIEASERASNRVFVIDSLPEGLTREGRLPHTRLQRYSNMDLTLTALCAPPPFNILPEENTFNVAKHTQTCLKNKKNRKRKNPKRYGKRKK